MIALCSMRSRTGKAPFYGADMLSILSAMLSVVITCFILSACSSRPVLSVKESDSLAEVSEREFVAASLQNVKGDYPGAVERYRKLLVVQPANAALHYALSKAYLGLGILDSARVHAEKSFLYDPGNKYYLRVLAVVSHQMNDYTRAIDLYRQYADLEPGSTEPLSLLALEYLAADQPEKALGVFHEILTLDPKNETSLAQVLLMEIKLLHYQDAIGTLTGLIEQGDGKDKLRLTLGELYMQTGQHDLALSTFREILQDNPLYIPAWLALLEASVQSGNGPGFHENLNRFYNVSQVTFAQQIDLAKLFAQRSSRDSSFVDPALVMIGEIQKRHPSSSQTYLLSGRIKLQKQDAAAAVIDLSRGLLLEPADIAIWEDLVLAYLMQKKYASAEQTLIRAKKRFPAMSLRLLVLEGDLLYQSGKVKKAALLLENVVRPKNFKKDKQLYLQAGSILAFCYDKLGYLDKSIVLYESILVHDPSNILMMNNLAYSLAVKGKELPRAKELAMTVVAGEPANAGYLDTLGWVLFRMGEYEKAREVLEKAAALDSGSAEILEHLGSVYEKLGEFDKAGETRKKVGKLKAGQR